MASQEVIVDALPYIDTGYDEPGVREAAIAMVEDEKKRYRPTKNYLEHLPPLNLSAFETEIMRNEFERLSSRQPMDTLSMKRYELPPPPPGKMTDVSAWSECVDNSFAQLEHQATRLMNLELLSENGSEAWKSHNEELQRMLSRAQSQLADLKKAIQEVNWSRKSLQTKAGEELRHLESTWVSLVSRNYDIEQACANLQRQIDRYNDIVNATDTSPDTNDNPNHDVVQNGISNENSNDDNDNSNDADDDDTMEL